MKDSPPLPFTSVNNLNKFTEVSMFQFTWVQLMPKKILLSHTVNLNIQDAETPQELLLKNVLLQLNTENIALRSPAVVVLPQQFFTPLRQETTLSFAMTFTEELKDTWDSLVRTNTESKFNSSTWLMLKTSLMQLRKTQRWFGFKLLPTQPWS